LDCGNGKHAYYRALRALCGWLNSREEIDSNPIDRVVSPKVVRKLYSAITEEQVEILLTQAEILRDKCIVSLLFDSGLRLSEMCAIQPDDIDWSTYTIRVVVKGGREAKAPFTPRTAALLNQYMSSYKGRTTVFNMKPRGVQDMLSRLSVIAGFPCNAHSFRRGFACHLHKKGLSILSVMHLGRWQSLEMVHRYTQSLNFDDCLPHYRRLFG
jgi:integrase